MRPPLPPSDPWRTFAPTCAPAGTMCSCPLTHSPLTREPPLMSSFGTSFALSLPLSLLCRYHSAAVKNDKLRAGELFKHHFSDMWRTDGAPTNYLAAEEEEDPDARYIVGMASLSPFHVPAAKGRKQQRPSITILTESGKMG